MYFHAQAVYPETFRDMTDKEIAEAVSLFKQLLKEKPNAFEIQGKNPIIENAYTSSSYVPGVYFPNTKITTPSKRLYEVICLAITKANEYALVFGMVDDKPEQYTETQWKRYQEVCPQFEFVWIDTLLYCNAEIKARKELQEYLKEYELKINALKSLKRAYKKDGKPFARLKDNYPDANITESRTYVEGLLTSFSISGRWYCNKYVDIYVPVKEQGHTTISADEFQSLIIDTIKDYERNAKETRNELSVMHNAFLKVRQAQEKALQVLNILPHVKTEDGKYMTSLGYRLKDYMKSLVDYLD